MNLQYLRYALEISRTGSISKAAENLSVAQPNLSRAVKELESSLGISIFDRTRTGMMVTPEGEKLLSTGARILREVDEMETMFDGEEAPRETVTVTAPHAAYLAHAFARFCSELPADGRFDLVFTEGGHTEAIGALARGESRLGIIRYPAHFEAYYAEQLDRQDLRREIIAELSPVIVVGRGSRLSTVNSVRSSDLSGLHEVTAPDRSLTECSQTGGSLLPSRRTTVSDRTTREAILCADPTTYECTLPLPHNMAERCGLITRPLSDGGTPMRDVLIYPAHYRLSALDRKLLDTLRDVASKL